MMAASSHKRIAKNSIVLYIRMLVMMCISIFTTRIVLEALGIVDYGIYNIVGGVVSFITMITGALTISVQRYLNYELGKEQGGRVSEVFSSAVLIHIGLALLLLIILETAGYFYFSTSINIPADRYNAALVVFHLSSIAACITLFTSPFLALIISYERMGLYATVTIAEVVLKLIIAYALMLVADNRLVLYGTLTLSVVILTAIMNIGVWQMMFREVRFRFKFHKDLFLQLTSFASWSAMGQVAWAFTLQGTNILLNLFFGNVLNAAYGITAQVNSAITRFVQSFQTAINPQIIKNYAKGDYSEVIVLVFNGTRYSCFLLFIMAVPLFFEIDNILNIWLTEVPDYTAIFCRIMLINILLDASSNYFATTIQATGKIRQYQTVVSLVLFLNFPLSYICLKLTNLPYMIYCVYGLISICLLVVRIRLVSKKLDIALYRGFIKNVMIPVLRVIIIAAPLSYLLYEVFRELGIVLQLVCFVSACVMVIAMSIYAVGLHKSEQEQVRILLKNKVLHGK